MCHYAHRRSLAAAMGTVTVLRALNTSWLFVKSAKAIKIEKHKTLRQHVGSIAANDERVSLNAIFPQSHALPEVKKASGVAWATIHISHALGRRGCWARPYHRDHSESRERNLGFCFFGGGRRCSDSNPNQSVNKNVTYMRKLCKT